MWHELCNVIGRRVVVVQETVINLRQIFHASFLCSFLVPVCWACVAGIINDWMRQFFCGLQWCDCVDSCWKVLVSHEMVGVCLLSCRRRHFKVFHRKLCHYASSPSSKPVISSLRTRSVCQSLYFLSTSNRANRALSISIILIMTTNTKPL